MAVVGCCCSVAIVRSVVVGVGLALEIGNWNIVHAFHGSRLEAAERTKRQPASRPPPASSGWSEREPGDALSIRADAESNVRYCNLQLLFLLLFTPASVQDCIYTYTGLASDLSPLAPVPAIQSTKCRMLPFAVRKGIPNSVAPITARVAD